MSYNSNCHTGSVLIFSSKTVEVYGGGTSHNLSVNGMSWVFDLTGNLQLKWEFPSIFTKSRLFMPNIVSMYIPDSKAPKEYGIDFWHALWEDLTAQGEKYNRSNTDKKLKVLFCCMGGHGRTGTVVTALAQAAGVDGGKDGDLLLRLRSIYCKEMVESVEQITYLKALGVETKELGSNKPYVGGGGSNTACKECGYWSGNHKADCKLKGVVVPPSNNTTVQCSECKYLNNTHSSTCSKNPSKNNGQTTSIVPVKKGVLSSNWQGLVGADGELYSQEEIQAMSDEEYKVQFGNYLH